MLGTIWTFNMFSIIFFVTGGEPAGESEILLTAGSILIPAALVFFFAQKHLVAGLTAGGTKG